jgi:hypothetical protein
MRRSRLALVPALLATLALAACDGGKNKNWLTYPGVAGHAKYFLLTGTPHDPYQASAPLSCGGCHTGPTFTTFDCTGCHTQAQCDPIHVGKVTGYTWDSPACYGCHRDGLGISVDLHNSKFFPIGTASHPATCTDCHTDLLNRGNTATLACASCHRAAGVDAKHAAVTGYTSTTASPDCVRCHADDQVKRIADHQATFGLLVGAPVAGSPKHVPDCKSCHDAFRTDKPWGADFTAYDCLGCHSDQASLATTHTGMTGYAYASPSCLGCHPTGQGHSAFFPIGARDKHAGIACTSCHTDLAHPTVLANFACASCHSADQAAHASPPSGVSILRVRSGGTSSTLGWTSPNCLRCHADSQVDAIASHPTQRGTPTNPSDHASAGCLTCHTALRTDKVYGSDWSTATGCSNCHD